MAGQGVRNGASFSVENLRRFAAEIGLQQEAFTTCLDSGRHTARVQAETAAGTAKGVNSTPTIFVNGQVIRGVPTFPDLQRAVLAALTAAR